MNIKEDINNLDYNLYEESQASYGKLFGIRSSSKNSI